MKQVTENLECKIQTRRRRRMLYVACCMLRDIFVSGQKGVTLMLTLVILSNVLLISSAVGIFSLNQFKIAASIRDSSYAIFAGTSGLERAFYDLRISNPTMCDLGTPAAPVSLLTDIFLVNLSYYNVGCFVEPVAAAICTSTQLLRIVSNGTYRQTTRTIEGSWCR